MPEHAILLKSWNHDDEEIAAKGIMWIPRKPLEYILRDLQRNLESLPQTYFDSIQNLLEGATDELSENYLPDGFLFALKNSCINYFNSFDEGYVTELIEFYEEEDFEYRTNRIPMSDYTLDELLCIFSKKLHDFLGDFSDVA